MIMMPKQGDLVCTKHSMRFARKGEFNIPLRYESGGSFMLEGGAVGIVLGPVGSVSDMVATMVVGDDGLYAMWPYTLRLLRSADGR